MNRDAVTLTSDGHDIGIAASAETRAWGGPVPNHAIAAVGGEWHLLCTGGRALANHNGGGRDCPRCLRLIAERISEDEGS